MTYNENANKASQKYHASHMKRIPLSVPLDEYAAFKSACDSRGDKVNTVLREAMREYVAKMDRK